MEMPKLYGTGHQQTYVEDYVGGWLELDGCAQLMRTMHGIYKDE
jgi:hypothetical protein